MSMTKEEIIERVHSLYPDANVDATGEECNFELTVISEAFTDQNTLQRQKPILALFKEDIRSGAMHALSIKAKTPAEHADQGNLVQLS
jgi:BolA protein